MANPEKQVKQAIEKLQAYHAEGRQSLQLHPERVPYGTSSERLRKARVFASRYTDAKLKQLIDRCRKYGRVLGPTFIDRLATVRCVKERTALELEVIKNGWSRGDLDRVIRARFGDRSRVPGLGRRPHRPAEVEDAVSELTRLCTKLVRWVEMMQPTEAENENQVTLSDLPASVRSQVVKLLPACEKLKKTTEQTLAKSRKQKT